MMLHAPFRIGNGYDLHRLVRNRPLMLAGVEIPYDLGLAGHSDADVVLHAVIDALLGAAALGDIGRMFPDTDDTYKGIDSKELLRRAVAEVHRSGWVVGNLDVTIVAERPKLSPHIESMRAVLANELHVPVDQISVKAKTNEGVDAVGRGEAIITFATTLLVKAP